jgi:putative ABC transport system permease protein
MRDRKRFGGCWMRRRSLEAAVNMKGAFNDITIKIVRHAAIEDVLTQIDYILKPYGGLISFARKDQISNFFVDNELKQLQGMGSLAPIIFLSVAAFLINVVMSRQVATQREQIGMLKAVGYTNKEVSFHYLKMVLVITVIGSVIGLALGAWMGSGMTQMYTEFFHFPILKYSFSLEVMILAVFSCTLAAVIGTLFAINNAAKLPPAEAMRPESPAVFKKSLLERLGLHQYLSFTSRIIIRQVERRPIRTLMSSIGIAFALSILIFSFFMEDSMDYLMDVQYSITQREDVNVGFVEAKSSKALEEIKTIPGVLMVEPVRNVPVYFKHNHFKKRGTIMGLINKPILRRVIDENLTSVNMPSEGIVLNKTLANILQLKVGDVVDVEVLEEKRQTLKIPVSAITQEFIGLGAFMDIAQLNNILDSTPKITGASLLIDQNHSALLYKKIKAIPAIIGLNITSVLRQIFEDIMAENLLKMVATNVIFASFISFGIIYNTARITLSERSRELASLRVLGLTRAEVAYILFGELGLITLLSLPIGIFLGYTMSVGMTESMDSELFRIPVYLKNSTYGYAVLIVLLSAMVSFYLVWRQVDGIDLVIAQKGVE